MEAVGTLPAAESVSSSVDPERLIGVFDSQAGSHHLDLMARQLSKRGVDYYGIGSSDTSPKPRSRPHCDPPTPRSCTTGPAPSASSGARQVRGEHPLRDMLHGIVVSIDDRISGRRHKVSGNADLSVIPQTSMIASHIPRAVGPAFSLDRAGRLGLGTPRPSSVCSFGDASANHSTATDAINAALHSSYQGVAMPLLMVSGQRHRHAGIFHESTRHP